MATYDPAKIDLNSRDRVGRPLVKLASQLVPGDTIHMGPSYDAPVAIVRANTGRSLKVAQQSLPVRSFRYDDEMTFLVFWPAVNVYSYPYTDNEGESRWALYIDDDEEGAITAEEEARGPIPPGTPEFGNEDDWLYETDARDFLATAVLDKEE